MFPSGEGALLLGVEDAAKLLYQTLHDIRGFHNELPFAWLNYQPVNAVEWKDAAYQLLIDSAEDEEVLRALGNDGELNRFHHRPGDTEGFVNLPLSIKDIDFSAFIREDRDYIKISLRSVGEFPCNQFATTYFNGGGHKNASGGEFHGTMDEAVALFERGLQELNPKKF